MRWAGGREASRRRVDTRTCRGARQGAASCACQFEAKRGCRGGPLIHEPSSVDRRLVALCLPSSESWFGTLISHPLPPEGAPLCISLVADKCLDAVTVQKVAALPNL